MSSSLTWPARAFGPRAIAAVRRSMGARRDDVRTWDSPQWREGRFHNSRPMRVVESGSRAGMAREVVTKGRVGKPDHPVPLVTPSWPDQAARCAATWLGHATVLLEVGGHRILTDPVWSERCSPSAELGPRRTHPVPVAVDDLPPLDVVLISHDHYDHLDMDTVDRIRSTQDAVFVVPLGIGAHLRRWDVPAERIVELDWGQQHAIGDLRLTCVEARHFSGRFLTENPTLWSAWLVEAGPVDGGARVFFGGDSGYTEAWREARIGPVDLTVLPIGAYDVRWPDVHLDPEEAVRTHGEIQGEIQGEAGTAGGVLLPIHWATFDLAFHPWREPADRVRAAAAAAGVRLAQPRPGERFEVDPAGSAGDASGLPSREWWA